MMNKEDKEEGNNLEMNEGSTIDPDVPLFLDDRPLIDNDPPLINNDCEPTTSSRFVLNFNKRRLLWKKDNLYYDENKILHDPRAIHPDIADLNTPYRCILHYFTPDFLQKIVNQSNLFAVQQNPSTTFNLTPSELKKFISILIFMSVQHLPSVSSCWHEKFGYDPIKSVCVCQ